MQTVLPVSHFWLSRSRIGLRNFPFPENYDHRAGEVRRHGSFRMNQACNCHKGGPRGVLRLNRLKLTHFQMVLSHQVPTATQQGLIMYPCSLFHVERTYGGSLLLFPAQPSLWDSLWFGQDFFFLCTIMGCWVCCVLFCKGILQEAWYHAWFLL